MAPWAPPPDAGDSDVWAAARSIFASICMFLQMNGSIMFVAAVMSWIFGVERGDERKELMVRAIAASILAFVLVPFAIKKIPGIDMDWALPIAVLIGIRGARSIRGFERWAMIKLGMKPESYADWCDQGKCRCPERSKGDCKGHDDV